MSSGNIFFAEHEGLVVLKFVGDIRYTMGAARGVVITLSAFLDDLFEKNSFEDVLIDLGETTSIDSTNLGLLAGVSRFTQKSLGKKPTILATSDDLIELLESVGFGEVFTIVRSMDQPDVELDELVEAHDHGMGLTKVLLDAHRSLMEVNEENRETFKDLVQMMEAEVERDE
jgi:anti-anti-sigma factor